MTKFVAHAGKHRTTVVVLSAMILGFIYLLDPVRIIIQTPLGTAGIERKASN